MEAVHPKKILEDFVRVLEERSDQVRELLQTLGSMARNLEGLKASVAAVLPRVETAKIQVPMSRFADSVSEPGDLASAIHAYLANWRPDGGGDCPLPELYRSVACGRSDCTLGRFHDAIRWLHDAGRIYLHPWTGPLYAMPEPGYALMVGHNVAYYASAR